MTSKRPKNWKEVNARSKYLKELAQLHEIESLTKALAFLEENAPAEDYRIMCKYLERAFPGPHRPTFEGIIDEVAARVCDQVTNVKV